MGDDTYGYAYDPIGNRTSATENTETTEYTANGLNQYSQISAPSVPSVVHPVCDANGQQKSAKPKAQPPGDRDFEAARMRGARSRRRRRGGNCNVTGYVATNGASVARREYDPFGRTTVAAGTMADDFNFWFSTKYLDRETGMSYYGYRFYSPELGRWPSRDPIEERGGLNLYGFVGNDPVNRWDCLGLAFVDHEGADAVILIPKIMPDDYFTGLNMVNEDGRRPQPGEVLGVTRYSGATLNCTCEKEVGNHKKGIKTCYKVMCKVKWTAHIYLNQIIQGDAKRLLGVFGHEQRHVKAVWDNVQSRIVGPLEGKDGVFSQQGPCSDACISHKKDFLNILMKLTSNTTERHGIDGHPNKSQLYDPLPASAWKGPTQGK